MNTTKKPGVNKNLYYVLPVISILIVIIVGITLIQPKIAEIQATQQEEAQEKEVQTKLQNKAKVLSQLDKNKLELQSEVSNLSVALPSGKKASELIRMLQNLASQSNVQIDTLSFDAGTIDNNALTPPTELNVSLAFSGSYDAIKTFLSNAAKAKRLMNVTSLGLANSASDESTITATTALTVYYTAPVKAPTDITEEVPTITPEEQALYAKLNDYVSYEVN